VIVIRKVEDVLITGDEGGTKRDESGRLRADV
jgi:hypothetical protein